MNQKKKPFRSWGIVLTSAIPYSAGWSCKNPECLWHVPIGNKAYKYIVGFSCEPKDRYVSELGRLIVGKIIFECPKCFEKFWLHFSDELVEDAMESCPNWPKE